MKDLPASLGTFDGGFEVALGHGRKLVVSLRSIVCAVRLASIHFTTSDNNRSLTVERGYAGGYTLHLD